MLALRWAGVVAAAALAGGCAAWAAPTGTPTETPIGADHSLTVINDTGVEVRYLYIETPGGGWPEDLLGEDVLAPGATYRFVSDRPDCVYELKAVFANGLTTQRPNVNLCTRTEISLEALLDEDAGDSEGRGRGPINWDGGRGSALYSDDDADEAAPALSAPSAAAPSPAPLDRGVPICPGDVRCKKKP